MKEMKEELLKRTRGELEEIAEKLGISTIGIPRTGIAKSILEAIKKSGVKEIPKKKAKLQTVKKGVFAKRASIDDQITKMGVGVKEMYKGVKEIQKDIGAQIKVNENFAAKMGLGVKEVHKGIEELKSAIDEETIELQKGIKEIHSGAREIQNGIEAMGADFRKYQHETVANYIKDFYYG